MQNQLKKTDWFMGPCFNWKDWEAQSYWYKSDSLTKEQGRPLPVSYRRAAAVFNQLTLWSPAT